MTTRETMDKRQLSDPAGGAMESAPAMEVPQLFGRGPAGGPMESGHTDQPAIDCRVDRRGRFHRPATTAGGPMESGPTDQPAIDCRVDGDRATRARGFLRSAALRRVVLVVAGLLVGFGVYSTNARMLVNEQLPMPFGVGVATVMSGSMEPTLHVGDLVVVQAQETPGDVAAGDIVVFQDGSSLVVHRVQRVGDGTLVTRGDANAVDDDPIAEGAVKGVVALSIPLLGSVVQVLHTPACMVAVLAVAVVLVELSFRANREGGDVELDALREEIELLRAQAAAGAQGAVPQVESAQAAEGANGAEVVEALEGAQAEAGAQAAAGTQRGQAAGDVEGGRS